MAKQEKCPVTDKPISRDYHVDYKGKRIYFCCPACPEDFKADPEKYMEKLRKQGVELEDSPKEAAMPTGVRGG